MRRSPRIFGLVYIPLAVIIVWTSLHLNKGLPAASQYQQPQFSSSPQQAATDSQNQKKAGQSRIQSQIQDSHSTSMNRYPDEYIAVQKYFQIQASEDGTKNKALLSFGSSTGEEAITLASMYFSSNKFTVFGVDLDDNSLVKAKASAAAHTPKLDDGKISFFNGKDTDMSVNGPYDAIFANSVLCSHGNTSHGGGATPKSIVKKYPFSDFEASLEYLDANLNVGGVLAIVNTNYHFSDTKLYKKYKTLEQCSRNFVKKVDVNNVAYEEHSDVGMHDCVWIKEKK